MVAAAAGGSHGRGGGVGDPGGRHKKSSPMSFLYWNLDTGFNDNRIHVDALVKEYSPTVVILGNTQPSIHQIKEEACVISSYQGFHNKSNIGHLSAFVKQGIEAVRLREFEPTRSSRCPLLLLKLVEKDLIKVDNGVGRRNKTSLVVCVLGENTAGANLDQLLDDIRDGVGKAINALQTDVGEEVPTLLLGTLEMFNKEWVSGTSTSYEGEMLRNYANHFGLVPKHREMTWFPQGGIGGESVDYALCTERMRCNVQILETRGSSDHCPVLLSQAKTYCDICSTGFYFVPELEACRQTARHRLNQLLRLYRKHKDKYLVNPHNLGLEVSLKDPAVGVGESDTEKCVINIVAEEMMVKEFKICLKNVGRRGNNEKKETINDEGIVVDRVGLILPNPVISLSDENRMTEEGRNVKIKLLPSRSYKINVHCQSPQVGQHRCALMISFYHELYSNKDGASGRYILSHMTVELNFRIQNILLREVSIGAPYEKPKFFSVFKDLDKGKYVRPELGKQETGGRLRELVRLEKYTISQTREILIKQRFEIGHEDMQREARECLKLLGEPLETTNYQDKFQLLLHCEETQMKIDIGKYEMLEVNLAIDKSFGKRLVKIRVPGLSENRPSVLRGDRINIKKSFSKRPVYEGYVEQVGDQDVYLQVSTSFLDSFLKNMKFDIGFNINRFPLRNMHRAVEMANKEGLMEVLFPTAKIQQSAVSSVANSRITCFNRIVENNKEQLLAVEKIVGRSSAAAPYIIFGPPGTGKTITMVESIKQVWKLQPGARIVAAAPSNAAADLLAERLKSHIGRGRLFRFHAPSRHIKTINANILDVSNLKDKELYSPSTEELENMSVIVVTLCTAGRLVSAKFPGNHFTHVFIDECGHANEPEAVIALAGILSSAQLKQKGQIVLAGDPKQLGAVLRSSVAKDNGLGISLLERLMNMEVYSPDPTTNLYNNNYITKLVKNFRSHRALLDLPSRLYYKNELVTAADPMLVNSMLDFPGLPDQARGKFPLIFHGVIGVDQREERSPSFFNPEEVAITVQYVKQILGLKRNKIPAKEIGIISPYRRQVQKIREQLYSRGQEFKEITVGSTEEFQGQERRVIIISCVRSQVQYINADHEYKLGFLKSSKRFNVAITRAKALMIIIGNPHILGQDPDWRALLDYSQSNGGYTGCAYSTDIDAEIDRLDQRLHRLMMQDAEEYGDGGAEEPAWRGDI